MSLSSPLNVEAERSLAQRHLVVQSWTRVTAQLDSVTRSKQKDAADAADPAAHIHSTHLAPDTRPSCLGSCMGAACTSAAVGMVNHGHRRFGSTPPTGHGLDKLTSIPKQPWRRHLLHTRSTPRVARIPLQITPLPPAPGPPPLRRPLGPTTSPPTEPRPGPGWREPPTASISSVVLPLNWGLQRPSSRYPTASERRCPAALVCLGNRYGARPNYRPPSGSRGGVDDGLINLSSRSSLIALLHFPVLAASFRGSSRLPRSALPPPSPIASLESPHRGHLFDAVSYSSCCQSPQSPAAAVSLSRDPDLLRLHLAYAPCTSRGSLVVLLGTALDPALPPTPPRPRMPACPQRRTAGSTTQSTAEASSSIRLAQPGRTPPVLPGFE